MKQNKLLPEKLRLNKENLKGYFTKDELKTYILVFTFIIFLTTFIAWLLYPLENNYSIFKDTISFLGSYDAHHNPVGWWLLSIAMITFGLMLLPIDLYRFRRFKEVNSPLAKLSLLFYVIASIGIALIGVFPDLIGESIIPGIQASRLHYIVAITGVGGFAFALLIDLFIFIYDRLHSKVFSQATWTLVYIVLFTVLAIGIYAQIMRKGFPGEGFYSFPLWEWIVFIMLFFILYTIIFSLPNDLETLKK